MRELKFLNGLTLESTSSLKVDKDTIRFTISLYVEHFETLDKAIKTISKAYKEFHEFFREKYTDFVTIKKIPIRSGLGTKKVEQTVNGRTETKYEPDGYRATCALVLSFKLKDARDKKYSLTHVFDSLKLNSDVKTSINYDFIVSDEEMDKAKKILQRKLVDESSETVANILHVDVEHTILKDLKYHVEDGGSGMRGFGANANLYATERKAAERPNDNVVSPEVVELLVFEDLEPVTIMDSITATWQVY